MTAETPPGTFASEATLRRDGGEQPTGRLRVLVADDDPLVRDGLLRALLADGRFEVVGQAADGRDAVALAEGLVPDLAALDLRMPILDGVRALAEIVEHVRQTHVVLL
ncbi:MAG: response regulator transcription factor, partial [Actinomycetota bacterium]|nr:response regulator transcription factor [Actinomycetota bacterium]